MSTSPGTYKGITINPGTDAQVAAQISAIDAPKTSPTINSTNTASTSAINVTPKVDNTNYAGMLAGAQTQALSIQQQIAGMNQPAPEAPKPDTSIQSYIDSITGIKQPNYAQTYQQDLANSPDLAQKQADLNAKAKVTTEAQGRLNNISAQLTALNTEAQAIPIQAQQQSEGRGITAAGLAPIQADQLRANALKALPLQAQAAVIQAEVATAQGNQKLAQDLYTQAQDHFDKMFTLQMQDAQNKYEFQSNLIDKVYQFADAQQQRTLDAQKLKSQQDFQTQQDTIANQRQLERDKIQQANDVAKIKLEASLKNTTDTGGTVSIPTNNGNISVPSALSPYIQTSFGGTTYADLSSLSPTDKAKMAQVASQSGIKPILDAGTAGKLNGISVSKQNLQNIESSLPSLLNDSQIPALQGLSNSAKSALGNADVRSFNAWRTAVINNVQALAGGQGSGLRINQAEIDTALKNDLPVITGTNADNLSQAKAKLANLNKQMDVWTKQILGGGNQAVQATKSDPLGLGI